MGDLMHYVPRILRDDGMILADGNNNLGITEWCDAVVAEKRIGELSQQLDILENPLYCHICGSCGEEGCCSKERCLYGDGERIKKLEGAIKIVLDSPDCEGYERVILEQTLND